MTMTRDECRSHHPSTQWQPDMERLKRAVGARLRTEGHPWPDAAATVLAVRGSLGLERDGFAELIGSTVEDLRRLEEGVG